MNRSPGPRARPGHRGRRERLARPSQRNRGEWAEACPLARCPARPVSGKERDARASPASRPLWLPGRGPWQGLARCDPPALHVGGGSFCRSFSSCDRTRGGGASSPGARGRGHRVASNRAAAGRAGCERRGPRDERPFQSRSREPRTRAERRPARRSGTGGSARVHREKGPRGRPASPAIATSAPAYLELAGSRWAPGRGVAGLPGTGLS